MALSAVQRQQKAAALEAIDAIGQATNDLAAQLSALGSKDLDDIMRMLVNRLAEVHTLVDAL